VSARAAVRLALVALLAPAPLMAQVASDWNKIVKAPLRPFQPQQPRRIALPNGLVIFLQEDHELPLVRGAAHVRGGSREEPAAKVGLVDIYGDVWRTGGSTARSGDDLDDFLEQRAAKVETSSDIDSTAVAFDTLKTALDEVFPVWLELLRQPAFREDKIELAKNQMNTGIARRNDDAGGIASREATRLVYGPDSPYARQAEYATVAAVTRDDLLAWHRSHVHPNNVIVTMLGDFDSRDMEARLRKAFAGWARGPAAPKVEVAFQEPKPGVYFIGKDDVTQSNVRLVHLGTLRSSPDYFALEVMNEVFGGGFSARLFTNVRTKKGLAYGVGGGVGAGWDHPGVFQVGLGTKSETTVAGIDALMEEIDNLQKVPVSADELKKAKDTILNSFVFRFDSKAKVLREKVLYEFYGYPPDFMEKYRSAVEAVTSDDVARVARQHVHKERLAILVVGKQSAFDKPLSTLGTVTPIDITIPEPGADKAAAAATAGSDEKGKALLARVAEGLGGLERVRAVKSLRQKSSVKAKTPQGEMTIDVDSLTVFPDRLRQQMQTPMGAVTMVVAPEGAFMLTPGGPQDMPASRRDDAVKDLKTLPLAVVGRADDPQVSLHGAGTEKVGDVEAEILDVTVDGASSRWLVDPRTGHVLRTVSRSTGPSGPAEQVTDFSDFRAVDGLTFAFKRAIKRGGQDAGAVEVLEVQVNPAVDAKDFVKPPAPAK
jgi:zinc protease